MENNRIKPVDVASELSTSFLDYSMSVIISRALPDVRDVLKPSQRRILYAMKELNLSPGGKTRKCSKIVGDTMGNYHPHGDAAIYGTLVNMAQDWSMRDILVIGQGNFGTPDGDPPAAARYTEAKLSGMGVALMADLDKDTVDFVPTYDNEHTEPTVFPSAFPNLLVNGGTGIAVGMATNMPPHNLGEVVDGICAVIDNPHMTVEELRQYIKGPDFPTGGVIANKSELPQIYETGMGKIKLRGKFEVELGKRKADKDKLIISEIPYTMIGAGINKFLVDVADLVESKKLTDVVDISNQSNKEGIRIVLELRKDADIDKIKNILYKKTKLEDTFGVNMLAIADGRPETLNLKGILRNFLNFQYENTERKYNVLLQKEMDKKEVQEGLIAACDCIDLIIAILRGSKNLKDAKACLTTGDVTNIHFKVPGFEEDAKKLAFTERQASAILEMRLYKLIGLEILALEKEHRETLRKIGEYKKILGSRAQMNRVIKEDLAAIKAEFATPRRTLIEDGPEAVYDESAVAVQEMVFVMDRFGYCKLLDKSTYDRNQETVDTEQVHVVKCLNTDKICLFAASGSLYQIKAMDVPAGKLRDKGTPIENLSKFDGAKDTIVYLTSAEDMKGRIFVFATKMAMVKQVPAEEFETNNRVVAATKLQEGDELAAVIPVEGETEVVIQTTGGVFLRFALEEISMLKKASTGVRGIRLTKNEELEKLYLIGENPIVDYKGKEVHLNRLKLAKRDGKGSKVRL